MESPVESLTADKDLLRRYRQGDEEAFAALYERHKRPLYLYLYSRLGCEDGARDVLQDLFARVCRSVERILLAENIGAYLHATARNLANDTLRKSSERRNTLEKYSASAGLLVPKETDDPTTSQEEADRLARLIMGLPEEDREIVILHVYSGLSFREIGDIAGRSHNTVYSRYLEAMDRLKAGFEGS